MSAELEESQHVLLPTPKDMISFLPYACCQLQMPFQVTTKHVTIDDYVSKLDVRNRKLRQVKGVIFNQQSGMSSQRVESEISTVDTPQNSRESGVILTIAYDPAGRLVELRFHRSLIPRPLIKIIAFCVPYERLLSKITIRWSRLDGFVLYEIAKILPQSYITEICLDDSPVHESNYYMLLEQQSRLRSLSLARCELCDEDCIAIAFRLRHPEHAAMTLATLSLSSNAITDTGAAALGEALRSNRTLRHLNVSGNFISDVGAMDLFRSLTRFPLTADEILGKRKRFVEYLRVKQVVYKKCYNELAEVLANKSSDDRSSKKRPTSRGRGTSVITVSSGVRSTGSTIAVHAELKTNELIGPHIEPFNVSETVKLDNRLYSLGNMSLCHLNLAHNNLHYPSLIRLAEVLQYQAKLTRKVESGLLRVVLDGNPTPTACPEFSLITNLLADAINAKNTDKLSSRRSEHPKQSKLR